LAAGSSQRAVFGWSDDSIELKIEIDSVGAARLTRLAVAGGKTQPSAGTNAALPLVDIVLSGAGRAWSGRRYCESAASERLRYVRHDESREGADWHQLRVDLADPLTGLRVEVFYRILAGRGALRSWVRLTNAGTAPITVESVTSLLCAGLSGDDPGDLDVLWCENDWLAEGRWQRRAFRDALPDLNRHVHGADPRGRFGVTSVGTWSAGLHLPMGAVVSRRTGHSWVWQVEHNGAWHWQVGECTRRPSVTAAAGTVGHGPLGTGRSGAYVAVLGPTDAEHHWHTTLEPGETFTTVPAAMAVGDDLDDALGQLTWYRLAIRRPHPDHRRLGVVFNDYMNTLMGEPTTERLLPLIEAAATSGAEYFVIDAGWYADPGEGWWDTVGAWKPAAARFPGGLAEVFAAIRAAGLIPGLWLEPEVVGVRSPIAARLPAEAFFTRHGQRVVENGRYHLDLRHPAAVKHLNETIDFVVGDLGAGYLKFDYNINGGPGTDAGNLSAGAGLLGHNRAHLDWLDAVLDRHPGLIIENCASGGLRTDYGMLSRTQVQSTSDQQDFLRYPPISAAAPAAITPEQAATWAYPQPGFSDREIVFTLCGALLGRVHLSGHVDRMTAGQRRLVADAVSVYKQIRSDLPDAVPFWPLGLPGWTDSWLALGMRTAAVTYLLVWHRGGEAEASIGDPAELAVPVPHLCGTAATAGVLYPRGGQPLVSFDPHRGELTVALPDTPAACLVRIKGGATQDMPPSWCLLLHLPRSRDCAAGITGASGRLTLFLPQTFEPVRRRAR
jgi:alpha-galactosidase